MILSSTQTHVQFTSLAAYSEFHFSLISDGVGHTGTFICIHSQLERLKTEGVVDVFQAIKSARIQRPGIIPSDVSDVFQLLFSFQIYVSTPF